MAAEPSSSRRSLLRTGVAGLAGLALGALGRTSRASAAAGGSIVMGASNSAGTTNTSLATDTDTGTAFLVTQNGTATALRGVAGNGIAGFFTSTNGSGVSGVVANKDKYGVYGGNDAAGHGGGAAMRAAGKQNHGLVATSDTVLAVAVRADNTGQVSATNKGVAILATNGGSDGSELAALGAPAVRAVGVYGVQAATLATVDYGSAVLGVGSTGQANGVAGYNNSTTGTGCGVIGIAASPDPSAAGVRGGSTAVGGRAVYGSASGTAGIGVYGRTDSAAGYGLYSQGQAGVAGNLSVSGSISKGSGSFKIDHPLDPANKYLYHSFVESPDMKNVYDGEVTLDKSGAATVTMPDWFEVLNRDTRIQLTPVGLAMPNLHVASKLAGRAFSVAGGEPGAEIYWQLTGIRKDVFAEAHRIPVEEAKPEGERGRYLHPVEHGQPKSKRIGLAVE